jgi:hypothetical protein
MEIFTAQGLPSSLYTSSYYFYTPTADGPVERQRESRETHAINRTYN